MFYNKIKAGALQLTLFIAVVITLLLLCFILLVNNYKFSQLKSQQILETVKQTHLGFVNPNLQVIKLEDTIDLLENSTNKLSIYEDYWGIHKKVYSESTIKKSTIKKIGLIGCKQQSETRKALYLKDNNRPLVLVGSTKISGDVSLPKKGVKSGNISGQSYFNEKLIYGSIINSKTILPELPKTLTDQLAQIKALKMQFNNEQYIDFNKKKQISNSFFEEPKVIYSKKALYIDKKIIGNIYIISEQEIIVQPNSNIKDVILIAPKIILKSNTTARIQAFATISINVESKCSLLYPSALTLFKSKPENFKENNIKIEELATVNGSVLILGDFKGPKINSQLYLSKNAKVVGEVYSNASIELYGEVFGSVYANQFITKENGSIYLNHLYNVVINSNKLNIDFVGLPILETSNSVLQWLY